MTGGIKISSIFVNGLNGKYSSRKNLNPAVKYGRNAMDNYQLALESADTFSRKHETDPPDVVVQYVNNDAPEDVQKINLLSAAFEEMGSVKTVSKEEMNESFKSIYPSFSAEAIDLNNDGCIDASEYSCVILLSDALSKDKENICAKNITGSFSTTGAAATVRYLVEKYAPQTKQLFKILYQVFGLKEAFEHFNQICSDEDD